MKYMKFAAVLAALFLMAGIAAAKPNFSGDWKMNATKSDFGQFPAPNGYSQKITHDDPNLKVGTKMSSDNGDFEWEASYTTDGKECTNTVRDNPSKSVLKWDGDTLNINTKANWGGNDLTIDDKWSLSADGKVLTITRTFSSSQGEMTQKVVLEKQ